MTEIAFPAYQIEPGIPGSITDYIQGKECSKPNEARAIRWTSHYQGETDYESSLGHHRRIRFRWGKCPWRWGFTPEGQNYWNYPNEETFQREFNGAWGILLGECANPVGPQTLQLFQQLYLPLAVTGYFDHERRAWRICAPTEQLLGTESWKRTPAYREFCEQMKLRV